MHFQPAQVLDRASHHDLKNRGYREVYVSTGGYDLDHNVRYDRVIYLEIISGLSKMTPG
jgi:hypothetical protein